MFGLFNKKMAKLSDDEWAQLVGTLTYLQKLDTENSDKLLQLTNQLIQQSVFTQASKAQYSRPLLLSIATQASLLILNLGLEWLAHWHNINNIEQQNGVLIVDVNSKIDQNYLYAISTLLDEISGERNGVPPLHSAIEKKQWERVFKDAYRDFGKRLEGPANEILFNKQASVNMATFFATMSESFFIKPDLVRCAYPDVYKQLSLFYRQNPAAMQNMNAQNPYTKRSQK